jgi:hypothetical protein
MKNISKVLFTLIGGLFLLGINSCNTKDFLKVDHYSILDANSMFQNDVNAQAGLVGCYDLMLPSGDVNGTGSATYDADWGFKPNLFVGGHPTMDTQATGWDKDWNTQNWNAGSPELLSGWKQCYAAINRCNDYLTGLEASTKITPALKTSFDGQARGIRAFFYMWLAKTFGRVPMLATGENYANTPNKARAATYAEMWDFIINDLKMASDSLDWDPLSGQYGRVTKGFALSYLGEAYMWKAYRVPDQAQANYTLAAAALLQVIQSGKYELNPSFTTLWDPGAVWTKECIWEEVLDQGSQWNGFSNLTDAHDWVTYFTACPATGGWGSLYLSWEWWSSYEQGDKRRDASGVTGAVKGMAVDHPTWVSATNYGYNPYLEQSITTSDSLTTHYHYYNNGDAAPSIWSLKLWRSCRADWNAEWGPQQIYYKRYANVLFDYAECLFNLNGANDPTAWGYINQIRNRAFGNLEVGQKDALTATYLPYYQTIAKFYESKRDPKANPVPIVTPTTYPLPFNDATVSVPDAQTYYTQVKADKGFTSPVWLVALGMERRKEFNCEWGLAQDLIRSGFMEDHITHDYPKGLGYPNTDPLVKDTWNTNRSFDFNLLKMDMPIPTQELLRNKLCDQNAAYK